MPEILIRVRNKIAESEVREIVCDNTDYTLRFEFDGQWEDGAKTVYFVLQGVGALAPAVTDGDTCPMPTVRLSDGVGRQFAVGVQQGAVKTTTPCSFWCLPSAEDALLRSIIEDDNVTLTWLEWVNANMAAAAENVRVAETVLGEAQTAASSASSAAETAAVNAEAARISAMTISVPIFSVDENGHVTLSHAERLGTTKFRLNEAGHMEVRSE